MPKRRFCNTCDGYHEIGNCPENNPMPTQESDTLLDESVEQAIANIHIHAQCSNAPSPNDLEVLIRKARSVLTLERQINDANQQIEKLEARLTNYKQLFETDKDNQFGQEFLADKKRLDWLEHDEGDYIGITNDYGDTKSAINWCVTRNREEFDTPYAQGVATSLRQAIDSAIAAQSTKKDEAI